MGKILTCLLGLFVFLVCLVEINIAIECLLCKSSNLDSECRLGQRKYKPKLISCVAPRAKCFALAQISNNGTVKFRRGCSIHPDFCETQPDVEFCQTCGSKFCNFWIMDISREAEDSLRGEEEAPLETTTKKVVVKKLKKRKIRDDAAKAIGDGSALSSGLNEDKEGVVL